MDSHDAPRSTPAGTLDDELDFDSIAQYLAELSEPSPIPTGVVDHKSAGAYRPEDITRDNNSWLQAVIDTQAWMCLDRPIGHGLPLQEAVELLFFQLAPTDSHASFSIEGDSRIVLTDFGFQHLETRLSRATAHKSAFLEQLDDEHSLAEASKNWRLLWEDADGQPLQAVAIKAEVSTWGIHYFKTLADQGDLDLNPSYQRDVVWSNSESQVLIESVLRGIPLPSVILTEADNKHQIVDGKQRLTAILRFIGQHPSGRQFVREQGADFELFDSDFRRYARVHHLKPREINEQYLPFKLKKYPLGDPLHVVSGRYYTEIRESEITIGDESTKVSSIFERATRRYEIPVIVYQRTSIRDIHHVFGLYNRQGRKLNAEELRNAIYHHLDLTRLLLVLSGDRPDKSLAPYLPASVTSQLQQTSEILTGRGFGTTRFKRTKVLSWFTAILMKAPNELRPDVLATPSTASHINALLDAVDKGQFSHPLFNRPTLIDLADDIQSTLILHDEVDGAWHPRFRTKSNVNGLASKWEELPLVASLIACFALHVSSRAQTLRENQEAVRSVTSSIRGPESTQNKTQWRHIANAVLKIIESLDLETGQLSLALEERYGYSCIPVLRSLAREAL